ncbi:MAG: transcription antitermination factor NusB [Sediminibacterium sp.]|nr:transcription antitermination factor NusB [Sediminibacterium sp.]MBP6144112.1 transcription antitermination factor NusB [Sediminibacterium sp.]
MMNRRNIRIKVMQVMYMLDAQNVATAAGLLQREFDKTRNLFVYMVHLVHQIARYAEIEALQRASKNLPNQADLEVNIKLAGNTIVWQTLESEKFKQAIEIVKPQQWIDNDMVKSIFRQLVDSPEYKLYISEESREKAKESAILKFIFGQLILNSENAVETIESQFSNWDDDGDMIIGFMLNYFQKPGSVDFIDLVGDEKMKFAKDLLRTVIEKKDVTEGLIVPKLKNWDPERIAVIDMILLRLGVCELLYFDTIPTKVSINEYIDLAKEYSTEQSGHFVNGILDNIHKELVSTGKIQKISHKAK